MLELMGKKTVIRVVQLKVNNKRTGHGSQSKEMKCKLQDRVWGRNLADY